MTEHRIVQADGRWNPKGYENKWQIHWERATTDLPLPLRYCKQHRTAIQAGGNVGAWAVYLAKRFKSVWTFEPDETNFRCLHKNIQRCPNIMAEQAALSDHTGICKLIDAGNPDSHYVVHDLGNTRCCSLDDLEPVEVDYIELDIEGHEYEAVKGALKTIEEYRPVLQLEDKGNNVSKGTGHSLDEILDLLPSYRYLTRVGRHDVILVPDE